MKVLIVGGGGREHAIALKIKENPEVTALYAAPGNGGIAQIATCLPFKATDVDGIVRWAAENKVDFVIVAPDDPLCLGMVDALAEQGIPAFGPRKNAAIIEGSKVFSKNLMKKYGIPTAAYETFDDYDAAVKYLQTADMPIVVKADGLALGKGVLICPDRESAVEAVASMMKEAKFGASGARVVIEEFLTGPEVSVLAFTDGKTVKPMVSSMDHKRALDHDEGLNTGGMGTIAPNPCYTPELAQRCMDEIFLPTIAAMNAEYLDEASVPAERVEKEKEILTQQIVDEGKPANIAEKIVAGRLNKFFKESCLVDQEFQFGDGDKLNVAQWLQAQSKTLAVCDYRRYSLSAE